MHFPLRFLRFGNMHRKIKIFGFPCQVTQNNKFEPKNYFFLINTGGSSFLSEFSSVPYRNRPSIVLKNSAKAMKNAIFYQNFWRF
jgi:hypothetical protein